MTDIYVEMCRCSPVQKDWEPKLGDQWRLNDEILILDLVGVVSFTECIPLNVWLPRQEDWQKIYLKHINEKADRKEGEGFNVCWGIQAMLRDGIVNLFIDHRYEGQDGFYYNLVEDMDILWCLFVHKEVYGRGWDWDNNKWVEG